VRKEKDESGFARAWRSYGEYTAFLREKKWRWVVGVLGLALVVWSGYSGVKHHNQIEAAKAAASGQSTQEFKYLND